MDRLFGGDSFRLVRDVLCWCMMLGAAWDEVGGCTVRRKEVWIVDCEIVMSDYKRLALRVGRDKVFGATSLDVRISNFRVPSSRAFSRTSFLEEITTDRRYPGSSYPSPRHCVRLCGYSISEICTIALSKRLDKSCGDTLLKRGLCGRRNKRRGVRMFGSHSTSIKRALVKQGVRRYRRTKVSFRRMIRAMRTCVRRRRACFILRGLSALHGGKQLANLGSLMIDTLGVGPIVNSAPRKAVYRLSGDEKVGGTLTGVTRRITGSTMGPRRGVLTVTRYGYPRHTRIIEGLVLRGMGIGSAFVMSATKVDDVCTGSNKVVIMLWSIL